MKISNKTSEFKPCPEYTGRGVCVDVTPMVKESSQFGERTVFKLVFECDVLEDGKRACVWSRGFTPSLHEKSALRKFLRGWFGRDLTKEEQADFELEDLIGKPAMLVVVHECKDEKTYANIAACTPDKSGAPLAMTGKYVRKKDRKAGDRGSDGPGGGGSGYRPAAVDPGAPAEGVADHASVKVHVGKWKGLELRDLSPDQVQGLYERWLPTAKANPKPLADDKRLMAALEWYAEQDTAPAEEDNVDY